MLKTVLPTNGPVYSHSTVEISYLSQLYESVAIDMLMTHADVASGFYYADVIGDCIKGVVILQPQGGVKLGICDHITGSSDNIGHISPMFAKLV